MGCRAAMLVLLASLTTGCLATPIPIPNPNETTDARSAPEKQIIGGLDAGLGADAKHKKDEVGPSPIVPDGGLPDVRGIDATRELGMQELGPGELGPQELGPGDGKPTDLSASEASTGDK